jgi:hypothetical protein
MTSLVSFSNFVAGAAADVLIGFDVPRLTAGPAVNQVLGSVIHAYSHSTPLGGATNLPNTTITQETRFDPFVLRAGQVVNATWDYSSLMFFSGYFTIRFVPLVEWNLFIPPTK